MPSGWQVSGRRVCYRRLRGQSRCGGRAGPTSFLHTGTLSLGTVRNTSGELADSTLELFQHLPKAASHMFGLVENMRREGTLSQRLMELTRLRIAFHNQCRICMSTRYQSAVEEGLDEATVCALEAPQEAENLSPAEKMAIEFADRFATDHLSIDGAFYERMREFFTDAEIVQLGFNCAFNSGFGRLFATWQTTAGTPDMHRDDDGKFRPWTSPSVIFPDTDLGAGR